VGQHSLLFASVFWSFSAGVLEYKKRDTAKAAIEVNGTFNSKARRSCKARLRPCGRLSGVDFVSDALEEGGYEHQIANSALLPKSLRCHEVSILQISRLNDA
jgi:hypothetical protein